MASSSQSPATPAATPVEKTTVVRPGWPVTSFKVEGVPEITMSGTPLTKAQLEAAEKAAEAQNFNLEVEKSGEDK